MMHIAAQCLLSIHARVRVSQRRVICVTVMIEAKALNNLGFKIVNI